MRKQPVQRRSQQMVESLVDAAGLVIAEQGLDQFTTVAVAARAGVSVGSLYQYFANKEALLAALLDRLTRRLGEVVNRTAPLLLEADLETIVRGLLEAALEFFASDEGLYLELLRNWYRLDIGRSLHRFEQNMMDVTRIYLLSHTADLRIGNAAVKQFVVTNSVVFTLLRYLSLPQQPLFARVQLVEELTAMIARYLRESPPRRGLGLGPRGGLSGGPKRASAGAYGA
jgi:AcrR family transcriptional regulator